MTEIVLAQTAGFCFGVTRAVDTVKEILKEHPGEKIYTYGPIIHNDLAVEELRTLGAWPVSPEEALKLPAGSTIVIRSHGIGRETEDVLKAAGLRVVDATCPFVKKIHRIAGEASGRGMNVIIVGDPDHPEVQGIRGWCGQNTYIVPDEAAAEALPEMKNAEIVCQTTFNNEKFKKIVENIGLKCYHTHVMNTICNATRERQEEAEAIASEVDAMIVIGGRSSSNSQKLYRICEGVCSRTYFIESAADLEERGIDLSELQRVGITAGASTPGNIIQEVLIYVRTKF